jgi:hypothetical protein
VPSDVDGHSQQKSKSGVKTRRRVCCWRSPAFLPSVLSFVVAATDSAEQREKLDCVAPPSALTSGQHVTTRVARRHCFLSRRGWTADRLLLYGIHRHRYWNGSSGHGAVPTLCTVEMEFRLVASPYQIARMSALPTLSINGHLARRHANTSAHRLSDCVFKTTTRESEMTHAATVRGKLGIASNTDNPGPPQTPPDH